MAESFELVILGGGLAGQCLARHLRLAGVDAPLAIVDRGPLPISPSTLKLGESTVEAGAWYLGQRLGLHERLLAEHEMKYGLRFFFSAGGNRDLGQRLELGPQHADRFRRGLKPPAYQLHRGRLEHMLARSNSELGVTMLDRAAVIGIRLAPACPSGGERHRVELEQGGRRRLIEARWLIDASGRAGLLTGPERLRRPLPHRVRVAWGWLGGRVDPEQWTRDPGFGQRLEPGLRWRSTVHLIGPGYSIWMIPVDPQITSLGVVSRTPGGVLEGVDEAGALLRWLEVAEPQLAAAIARFGWIEGPRFGPIEAHVSRLVVSARRFAICGEAAANLDPLYSSGVDLLAMANEMIVASYLDELAGRPLAPACEQRNAAFAQMARQLLTVYADAYRLLDAPRIATHKISWDVATYLGYLAPLVMSGSFAEARPLAEQLDLAARVVRLNNRMQALFADWRARAGRAQHPVPAVNLAHLPPVARCFARLGDMRPSDGPERWRELLRDNLAQLEDQALATFLDAAADLDLEVPSGPLDAYAVGLDPRLWPGQGLVGGARARSRGPSVAATRRGMDGEGPLNPLAELEPETPPR